MVKNSFNYTPLAALSGSLRDYRYPRGANLEERVEGLAKWRHLRVQHGLWPYVRAADERAAAEAAAPKSAGVDFTRRDHLGLGAHASVKAAAKAVIETMGVHVAGAPGAARGRDHAVVLERTIADFLGTEEALLFPTGWAAGYGVIKALIRSTDHVVMDAQARACLQEGAASATRNIYLFRHNVVEECRKWLEKIRAKDSENAVMVVTESLFPMESDAPDLSGLQALCSEFHATLLVNVAHDFGALGKDGRGVIGDQDMVGKIDLVSGSLSHVFGTSGGFVACRNRKMKEYLRFFSPWNAEANALSPLQTATAQAAFEIVQGAEGQALRERLMVNILSLRRQLVEAGFEVYGAPSAVVCVKLGPESLARLVSRRLPDAGLIANLAEFPAVPKGQARIPLQVTASHTDDNIRDAVTALKDATTAGRAELRWLEGERDKLRTTNG